MPRAAPQRGDFTGQERQRLTEEKAKEIADRQGEIGLVNQVDIVVEQEGIFDPVTGELTELPQSAQAKIEQLQEPVVIDEDEVLDPATPPRVTPDPMKNLQDLEVKQQPKVHTPNALEVQDLGEEPIVVEDEWRIIRVNTDIEDMTYGVDNNLTFLRGRRYRVPRHLYNWLESRGVVYH
jgi:hypothetical protein